MLVADPRKEGLSSWVLLRGRMFGEWLEEIRPGLAAHASVLDAYGVESFDALGRRGVNLTQLLPQLGSHETEG